MLMDISVLFMLLMKMFEIISEVEGKQKNVQAERRNRRVLGDIGNVVKAVDAGKPKNPIKTNRPMTRFHNFPFLLYIFYLFVLESASLYLIKYRGYFQEPMCTTSGKRTASSRRKGS